MSFRFFCSVTLPQLLLVLLLIESGDTGSPLSPVTTFDWDIVVSQGNGVALISVSSPAQDPLEITFPMPKLEPNRNRSELMRVVSLDSDISSSKARQLISYEDLDKDWRHFEVKSLASDASRNLLYFSHSITTSNYKLTNLCVFNLTSFETKLLLQTSSGSIDTLDLREGDLFFMEGSSRAIFKLKTSETDSLEPNNLVPIIVKQFEENPVSGFVIGSSPPRTLFWSANKPSTIYYQAGKEKKAFVFTDLKNAHDLHIFNSQLYFMNTPQFGPEKKIERVSLTNSSQRDVVINFEHLNQVPSAFTVDCEFIYWTDTMSKALWKIRLSPTGSKGSQTLPTKIFTSTKVNRHFNVLFPHAVTTRREYLEHSECIPRELDDFTSTTSIPILMDTKVQNHTKGSMISPSPASLPMSQDLVIKVLTTPHPASVPAKIMGSASVTPPANSLPGDIKFCGENQSRISCLNGATCLYWEENLFCLCTEGFTGPKCEVAWDQGFVEPKIGTIGSGESSESCSSANAFLLLLITAIGGVAVALSVLAIILGVKVHRLSRIPKVHRRFIVARPSAQRSRHPSNSVCEMIDIENCCNMTICETPCYDSETGRVSLVRGSLGQEDKERLLDC